jgi:tyrosinase
MSQTSRDNEIPSILLRKTVKISRSIAGEGEGASGTITIPNPLRSYKLQWGVWDNFSLVLDADYSKPKGYESKRYPFSGLVGSDDVGTTEQHNKLIESPHTHDLLNQNITSWLSDSITISTGKVLQTGTFHKYERCLMALIYTIFSNNTSATQYNEDTYYNTTGNEEAKASGSALGPALPAISIESPYNDVHLAIGVGCEPTQWMGWVPGGLRYPWVGYDD